MDDQADVLGTRSAQQSAVRHTGPTADRYHAALAQYLAIAAHDAREHAPTPGEDAFWWTLENLRVQDVMTTNVITVEADTPFRDIAAVLSSNRIASVPVLDQGGSVIGVVSASDLMAKVVAGGAHDSRVPGRRGERRETYRKARGETAADIMSRPAITVRPDHSVVHAARVAAIERVRRLPVVGEDGRLRGIVARSDLLRVFLRSDDGIREHVLKAMVEHGFDLDPAAVDVQVENGVVTLRGQLERRRFIDPLLDAVRTVTGVVAVHDQLTYQVDDTVFPMGPAPLY